MTKKPRMLWGFIMSIAIFFIAFSYAMFQGGFVSWFVFYSYLPVFLYILLLFFYPLNRILIERELKHSGDLQAGDHLFVEVTVTFPWVFPLFYVAINDGLPDKMINRTNEMNEHKALLPMQFKRTAFYEYEIDALPRGEHVFHQTVVKTGDVLGLYQKSIVIETTDAIIVYPKQRDLSSWQPLNHSSGGTSRSRRQFEADLTSISSVRDYTPGDRLSWLDWKATARSNKLVTKQFDFPVNRDVLLVLDATVRKGFTEEAFERETSLAASLVKRAIELEAGVGLLPIHEDRRFFQPDSGHHQEWILLNHLALIQPVGEKHPATVLHAYLKAIPQQMTCLYVGYSIDQELVTLFSEYLYRGMAVEQFLVKNMEDVTPAEFGHIETLKQLGIKSRVIPTDEFDFAMRAGGNRATI